MYLVTAILKSGRHFEFWNFFRWLTGFIKRAIFKEYVCQFWCLFPKMKDSYDILLLSAPLTQASHGESSDQRGGERGSEDGEKRRLPPKTPDVDNLAFPLAHTSEEMPDGIPGVLGEAFSRRS